jgi:hypothetical protein
VHHQKTACLPAEQYRQNSLFRMFNSINPQMKSALLEMLRDVDVALVDHFNQSRRAWAMSFGAEGATDDTSDSIEESSTSSLTKAPDALEIARVRVRHQFMLGNIRSAL